MHTYVGVGVVSNEAIPRTTIYGVSGMEGLLIDKPLTALPKLGKGVIINFRQADEKVLVKSGVATVSISVLLSVAGGCSYDAEEINDIFKKTININYRHVFLNDKAVDFTLLFRSPRFWGRIANLVRECLDILQKNGLMDFLALEVQLVPILHRMFDAGYPIDVRQSMKVYEKLRAALRDVAGKIKDGCKVSDYMDASDVKGKEMLEWIRLRDKLEDKLRRFPTELLRCKQKSVVIPCNFRSIGTDTFRITTNHTNIQGLPKEIRRCLRPRRGDMLIEYDLVSSQVMILAYLSGEDSLIQSYLHGEDLYLHIAAVMAGKQANDITAEERGIYKLVILQMLYGAGVSTLQQELAANGVKRSYAEIREMQRRFYASFPAIRQYSDMVKEADSVTLPTGRKWNLKDSVKPYKRLSYIMQYIESVILREALVLLDNEATSNELWLYLCIHDSVFVETNSAEYAKVQAILRRCFNEAVGKCLPIIKQTQIKEDIIYEKRSNIRGVFR